MTPLVECHPKTAIVSGGRAVSYADLLSQAHAWSALLAADDERVVILSENSVEWLVAALAIWAAGRTLVPVDFMASAEEVAYILDDCRPPLAVCSASTRPTLDRAIALARHMPRIAVLDELPAAAPADSASPPPEAVTVDEDRVGAIVYTSGTTGDPKGVMLTFGNLIANVGAVAREGYFTPETRALLILPLHHVLPLAGSLVAPLFAGGTIVIATSLAGEDLVATMQRNAVTIVVGVPRFYDLLHRALRAKIDARAVPRLLFRLASRLRSPAFSRAVFGSVHRRFGGHVRFLVSGGAPLAEDTAHTFRTLGFAMCVGYGMTECAPIITFPRIGGLKPGSCGQPLPGTEVRFVDGEILTRGPNVMRGYYERPDETAAVLQDGWLHTGDLGHMDADGHLFITGRRKEIIVLPNGKNVNPALTEAALEAAPAVREVGVFLDGEVLHAHVLPSWEALPMLARAEASDWIRREVLDPYNATVAPYRRVLRVSLAAQELPRTRLGKLRRHLLPELAAAATRAATQPVEPAVMDPIAARLSTFLGQQYRRPVDASTRLESDLGVDSLGRVELAVFVQQAFGPDIPESRLGEFATVGDLARFIAQYADARDEVPTDVSWRQILSPQRNPALPTSSLSHRALVLVLRAAVRLSFRLRVRGVERLPASPFILAPNHQSFFDGLFVIAFLKPRTVLRTLFYAKEKHVRPGWLKSLAARCNTIVMSAEEGFLQSLQKLAAGLRRGHNVIIFPEGTRSVTGALGRFRESYAILARELRMPVVPVVIDGAHLALPKGRLMPRILGRVSVTYLDPMLPTEGETPASFNQRVRACIERHLEMGRAGA